MIISCIYNCLKASAPMVAIAAAMLAGGCRAEDDDAMRLPSDGGIVFGAAVHEKSAAQTRTLVPNDITQEYDVDFFVQLDYADTSAIKRYTVASSYAGRLDAKFSDKSLIWQDASSDHTFYAWTLPWMKSADEGESEYADETESEYAESCLKKYYDENGKPVIEVEFHDSGDGEDYEKYKNNEILEKFIGAQSGPYNYKQQGSYVPLTFYHLVSQVFFNKLTVIRGDNSRHDNLKANLTFIGMPKKAKFDPHPSDQPHSPHPAEWIAYPNKAWDEHPHHPVVIGPEKYDPESELTFFMPQEEEEPRLHHRFYICPEIDFSQLAYKVTIVEEDAPEFGIEYYGDFSTVEFQRIGTDYDNADKTDSKVLHAGEIMQLNITLHPGVGPGATIVIQDWSDPQPTQSSHYAHRGIFTDNAAQELADASAEDMEELFGLYGETVEGEKVFKIYENVTVTGDKFPVHEGYVVDGMGHTITMGSSPVTVGAMRDVYLTDGTNTIWIDPTGKIWVFDSSKMDFVATENSISGRESSTIDLATGAVS